MDTQEQQNEQSDQQPACEPGQSHEATQLPQQPERIDVILASGSPRRKELLEKAGVRFTVRVSEVDEALDADQLADPPEAAKKLAERKAGAVVQEVLGNPEYCGAAVVIGADTMVVLDGVIFGKPKSLSDAKGMLRKLAGKTHEVHTSVSVWMIMALDPEKVSVGFRTFCETSRVTFKDIDDDAIADYLKCGESFDKAGAYAVQGEGAKLVERVDGDIDTVIGLPVTKLLEEFPDLLASE